MKTHLRSSKNEIITEDICKFNGDYKNNSNEANNNNINIFNYINYKKYFKENRFVFQKRKKDLKNHEDFDKKELKNDIINQKNLDNDQNYYLNDKMKFNFVKNKDLHLKKIFRINKNISHIKFTSMQYNFSEKHNSLQKYFSLSPNILTKTKKEEIDDINLKNYEDIISSNYKLNITLQKYINDIKEKGHNKLFQFEDNYPNFIFFDNNLVKSLNIKKFNENKFNFFNRNKKNLIYLNQKNYSRNEKNQIDNLNSKHKLKISSLNTLHKLEDYIGPNQYSSITFPNNTRKILEKISEKIKIENSKIKFIYKAEERKKNEEYCYKVKNRKIKSNEDYFNIKDLDKLVLSEEKNSKVHNIKNKLYETAFKKYKYVFSQK